MPTMKIVARALARPSLLRWIVPIFLCPLVQSARLSPTSIPTKQSSKPQRQHRCLQFETNKPAIDYELPPPLAARKLPLTCPGCGAYSQTLAPKEAGFYSSTRKPVRAFLAAQREPAADARQDEETAIYNKVIKGTDSALLDKLGLDNGASVEEGNAGPFETLCQNWYSPNQQDRNKIKVPIYQCAKDVTICSITTKESLSSIRLYSPFKISSPRVHTDTIISITS